MIDESTLSQLESVGEAYEATPEDPAGTFARKIINDFLVELSFNSSRLEGNTIDLAGTQELFEQVAFDQSDPEKIMLINIGGFL